MSRQKCKASHPSIKQYSFNKLNKIFLLIASQKVQTPAAVTEGSFDSLVREEQHSTVRISKASSVSANSQSAVSNNKTFLFQSRIKLKGCDESLQMNVLTLHANGGVICLRCSKHPAVTTGREKNGSIYSTEPASLHAPTAWTIISALINTKKPIAWKKTQPISPFHAIHQDRISDKVNTVVERVHLICWVLKEEIANRKTASLQTLVDRIGHNDRLHNLHQTSSVAVTEFILLISEHFGNRIVSDRFLVCFVSQKQCLMAVAIWVRWTVL